MSWKTEWRTIFWPEFASGGLDNVRDQVALRLFENAESPATTGILAAAWTGSNVTVTRETTTPLNGEGSIKVVVAGGVGSVYKSLDRAKFGYPFPGHNSIRIRYVKFRATVDSGTSTIRVTFGDVSDANHYRYWTKDVAQSKYTEFVVDLDPDNEESYPAPTTGVTAWDSEQIDRFGFTNLTDGRTYYFDDVEFIYEYSLPDLIGFPTEAPVDMGDIGSLHARINGVWANVKALEGKTEQYVKQGIATVEVGQPISWALELLSDFAPPTTTEITPGNYTIDRIRHSTTINIVASTLASESAGTIYASYQPQEDNWTEGDLMKATFSGGYVETDEEPVELLTANANSGQKDIKVDNAYQWQVGWRVRIYDGAPATEYNTIASLPDPTTVTMVNNLANNYTTAAAAAVTRVIQTELTTAVFFTRITREPTAEEYGRNFEWSDHDLGDVLDATADNERWSSEVIRGAAEASVADINSTIPGKIYILADPDATPVATGYGVRRKDTSLTRFFETLVDDTITWGDTGANSGFSNLVVSKGGAFDATNYIRIGREKSGTVDRLTAEANFAGAGATTTTVAITDDALAFKIWRIANIWRCYYSATQYPDFQWVLVAEFEDTTGAMTEETSIYLESYSPGNSDAQTVRSDFDNFVYQVNSAFLEQMYEEMQVVPIVQKQEDPRVDQNTAAGIEIFRVGLINTNNGLPVVAEIAPGTTLVDRFREGTDADWTNQAGETITNAEANGYVYALYDFPNATWKPGDQARFRLQSVTITDATTGRVITVPDLSIYFVVGGPPNADETQNLWLGDVIGNKFETPVPLMSGTPVTAGTASIEAYVKALASRGVVAIHGVCNSDMVGSTATIVSDDLIGYGNDHFNSGYQMVVLKNANNIGVAPEMEMRDIADYVSATGTFTTEAFSANVEASDVILVLANQLAVQISVYGIADAGSDATQIRDSARVEVNDWWNGQTALMLSGLARGQSRPIWDFVAGTDDIEVSPNFDAVIAAGDVYAILPVYNQIVPRVIDDTKNELTSQVVGRKDDTVVPVPSAVATDTGYIKALTARGMSIIKGQVTSVEVGSETTTFYSTDLIGFGDDYFNEEFSLQIVFTASANLGVTRDITDYVSATGKFVTAAFAANMAVNDEFVVLHKTQLLLVPVADTSDPVDMTAEVPDGSVLANVLTDDGDTSVFDRRRSSLEAICNALGIVLPAGAGFEGDGTGATLYKTLVAAEGATTAVGTTATFVDAARVEGVDYWNGNMIVALSGSAVGQVRTIVDDDGAGTLTVESLLSAASGNAVVYVILNFKNADWIVGANNANNAFVSSAIVANSDGSVLERLEHILVAIGGTTGVTTGNGVVGGTSAVAVALTQADDYWNGGVFVCVDGANAGLARPICDFDAASDTVFFEPGFPSQVVTGVNFLILTRFDAARLVGDNNNNNAFATGNVVGNVDGSVFERIEALQRGLNVVATGVGGGFEEDGSPNLVDALGTNGTTVTDSATSVLGAIGVNNNDNAFSSANVVANEDGSILERLEDIANGGKGTDAIFDLVNAELVLQEAGGTVATDGMEQNVYINNAPAGVYKPICVLVDLDNMAGGDIVVFRVYYRLKSGGGLQLYDYLSYTGADGGLANGEKLISMDLLPNRFGVQVTLQRTAGVDRNFDWEVLFES